MEFYQGLLHGLLRYLKCMFMLFNILLYSQKIFRYGLILFSQIIYPSG